MSDKTKAVKALQRACGWGAIEAHAYVERLTDSELSALARMYDHPPRRGALDKLLGAVHDRQHAPADIAQQPPAEPKRRKSKPPTEGS